MLPRRARQCQVAWIPKRIYSGYNSYLRISVMAVKILFVCWGMICCSPTAAGIFKELAAAAGRHDSFLIDSAGTADWRSGKTPDARTMSAVVTRVYDLTTLRARQVCRADFEEFDYILAMDNEN